MAPSTGHQGYHTCCFRGRGAMLKGEFRVLFFLLVDIHSVGHFFLERPLVLFFAFRRLYAKWRIDDLLAFFFFFYCRSRGLHICLPTRRCVRIKVAFCRTRDSRV